MDQSEITPLRKSPALAHKPRYPVQRSPQLTAFSPGAHSCGAFLSHMCDQASPSRSPPRLPMQVSGPEQKTQQLPLLFPHESKHIACFQAFCRLARIGLDAPTQKFTPPRRQPMPARRIPKKPYRSKQTLNPPSECKSPPTAFPDPI